MEVTPQDMGCHTGPQSLNVRPGCSSLALNVAEVAAGFMEHQPPRFGAAASGAPVQHAWAGWRVPRVSVLSSCSGRGEAQAVLALRLSLLVSSGGRALG